MQNLERSVLISDPTLRDGNHAVRHQLTCEQISIYAVAANAAGIPIVEVGHGNGLGASSLQVGLSKADDKSTLEHYRSIAYAFLLVGKCIFSDNVRFSTNQDPPFFIECEFE